MSIGAFRPYRERQDCAPAAAKRPEATVRLLTVSLLNTYQRCEPTFRYTGKAAPRRVLTKPAAAVDNNGHDNANADLIVAVGDVFVSTLGTRYVVQDLLGHGTFGQVFRCRCSDSGEEVAVKVIKNQAAYYHQARVEIGVLQLLNTRADPDDSHHIVRMKDFFVFHSHLCLVFELLSLNLYELIKHNKFRGLSLSLVRVFVTQILDALAVLRDARIIHCDLKPENVLVKSCESGEVKVIDFGSACFENRTVYSYIQSRFYRSPEVVLGLPYTMAIDMWSLGCVAAELFLGLPLFPGACEHDLLARLVATLGQPSDAMLAQGRNSDKFFAAAPGSSSSSSLPGQYSPAMGQQRYRLRSREEFEALTGQPAPVGKTYFQHTALGDIVGAYPFRSGLSFEDVQAERRQREAFTDFLLGVLDPDPSTRWSPRQAAKHPFITGEQFIGPFQPAADPSSTLSPAPIGTPMSIPSPQQRPCGSEFASSQPVGMAAGSPWVTASGAAALLASSPQVHAHAHAAAMAAVQVQMRQQAALVRAGALEYDPARSLQNILPGALGGVMPSPSSYDPLHEPHRWQAQVPDGGLDASFAAFSPPSRAFGTHLRYADAALQSFDAGGTSVGSVLPLLQTPVGLGGASFSPMSFQPSSIRSYQAALAAAISQQQQQLQMSHAGLSTSMPRSARAQAEPAGQQQFGSFVLQQQQQQGLTLQMQYGVAPAGTAWQKQPSMVGWRAGTGAVASGAQQQQQQQQQSNSRWTSCDGSAGDCAEAEWDPLWSEDLLKEEEPASADSLAKPGQPSRQQDQEHFQLQPGNGAARTSLQWSFP